MKSKATSLLLVAVLPVLLVAAACGKTGDSASTTPTTIETTTTTEPATTTTAPSTIGETGETVMITPYFIRDGKIIAGQQRAIEGPTVGLESMNALIAGTNDLEAQLGLVTGIAKNVKVTTITVSDGVATIDLNRPFETANTRPQVAQVVFTLTQFESVDAVKFLIDGQPNGATGVMPISRADLEDVTPAVLVDSPTPGATVGPKFAFTGSANTFEANVPWNVVDQSGTVIAQGAATATSGNGVRGDFTATIDLGTYRGAAELVTWVDNMESGGREQEIRIPLEISS